MPPRVTGAGAPLTTSKSSKKERIIQALSRMNDRDTQKAAAEELFSILLSMDQEGLPIILSGLCTTSSEHKVYARKECARAIGIIASDACPLRDQALQQPHLGKMLGQLRKCLQDADSSVREASSEAVAMVAQGLAQVPGSPRGTLANPVLRLLFDCLGEQKKELNGAACAALGMAAPYVGTLDSALARELVRKLSSPTFQASAALMQALARTDPGNGEPMGLIKSGPAAFIPLLSSIVGQPAAGASVSASTSGTTGSGSGAAAAMLRSDWPVRLAAADMLRATALLLGPLMEPEGCWNSSDARSITGRAAKALETCKFDKVREVRDVARAALTVMEELQAYGSQGGSAAGWPVHIASKLYGRDAVERADVVGGVRGVAAALPGSERTSSYLAGRKSPVRRSATSPSRRPRSSQPPTQAQPSATQSPPPRRTPTPPERRSSPVFARTGSLTERFRAAHRDGDVSVLYPGGSSSELPGEARMDGAGAVPQRKFTDEPISAPRPPVAAWPQDDTRPDVTPGSRALSKQQSRSANEGGQQPGAPHIVEPLFTVRPAAAGLEQQPVAGSSAAAVGIAADAPARMLGTLSLQDGTQSLLDSGGPPTFSRFATGSGAGAGLQPPQPLSSGSPGDTVTMPAAEWQAMTQRLRSLEAQHRQLLEAFESLSSSSSQTIQGLQTKVVSMEAALEVAQSQLALAAASQPPLQPPPLDLGAIEEEEDGDAEKSWLSRTIKPGSPLMPPARTGANHAAPAASRLAAQAVNASVELEESGLVAALPPAADVRQAYREALSGGRLSDMHLLRLMQRTGPVWNGLGYELASQLLASFTASLQQTRAEGPMIPRMMPWLWRLADDQRNTFMAPQELRAPLLAALRAAQPSVTDPALYENVALLISTLRAHWSLPEPGTPSKRVAASIAPTNGALAASATPPIAAVPPLPLPGSVAALRASATGVNPPGALSWNPIAGAQDPLNLLAPSDSPSPAQDPAIVPSATPRLSALRTSQAARTPSINTLMGQWSDLQRDFAAMSSPAGKGPVRTTGQA